MEWKRISLCESMLSNAHIHARDVYISSVSRQRSTRTGGRKQPFLNAAHRQAKGITRAAVSGGCVGLRDRSADSGGEPALFENMQQPLDRPLRVPGRTKEAPGIVHVEHDCVLRVGGHPDHSRPERF